MQGARCMALCTTYFFCETPGTKHPFSSTRPVVPSCCLRFCACSGRSMAQLRLRTQKTFTRLSIQVLVCDICRKICDIDLGRGYLKIRVIFYNIWQHLQERCILGSMFGSDGVMERMRRDLFCTWCSFSVSFTVTGLCKVYGKEKRFDWVEFRICCEWVI